MYRMTKIQRPTGTDYIVSSSHYVSSLETLSVTFGNKCSPYHVLRHSTHYYFGRNLCTVIPSRLRSF